MSFALLDLGYLAVGFAVGCVVMWLALDRRK